MEESKKLVRTIMIVIVLTAIVLGIVYYYHDTQNESMAGKGTLITAVNPGWYILWQ